MEPEGPSAEDVRQEVGAQKSDTEKRCPNVFQGHLSNVKVTHNQN